MNFLFCRRRKEKREGKREREKGGVKASERDQERENELGDERYHVAVTRRLASTSGRGRTCLPALADALAFRFKLSALAECAS